MESEALKWFLKRFTVLIGVSVIAYFLVPQYVSTFKTQYTWITISLVWLIGLYVTRWQYNNLPEETIEPRQPFNLGMLKNTPNSAGFEPANSNSPANNPDTFIRELETRTLAPKKQNPQQFTLEKLLERSAIQGLLNNTLNITLELPETEVKLLGKKWHVKKATLKVKTRKPKTQTQTHGLERFFNKAKKRVA